MNGELWIVFYELCKITKTLHNCKTFGWLFPYCFIFSAWISTNSPIYNFFPAGCPVALTICNILIINSLTRTTQAVPRLSLPFPFIPLVSLVFQSTDTPITPHRFVVYPSVFPIATVFFCYWWRRYAQMVATIRVAGRDHLRACSPSITEKSLLKY